ncbi:MAG: ABC transporter ATP-binding protein [Acidobacteria bacterium]|nr:ABC transporter ATP-binding protein [Acidobacteriota bacterium]
MPPSTPILTLSHVSKNYGIVTALRDVNLEVYPGDFIALFGPNGAGKTTLLKIVASLVPPTRGELVFHVPQPGKVRQLIGYVSHQSLVYNEMTAVENLVFYGKLYGLTDLQHTVEGLLEKIGLWEARHQLVRGFSRGMKQRLTLARALLHRPEILLLDEPYTGLDQHASRLLTHMLRDLRDEHKTILLITHNLSEGLELSNRVIIQNRGEFVFEATRASLARENFENLYFEVIER